MNCEICQISRATEFMVVRQTKKEGGERVAKAHVCLDCFEIVAKDEVPEGSERNGGKLRVDSISAQDFHATVANV